MKPRLVLSLAAILAVAQIGFPGSAPADDTVAPALSTEEQRTYDHLQAVDDRLRHRLRYVEEMAAAGREPGPDLLAREVARFHRRLRFIEGEVRALGPDSEIAAALLDKVRALARALGNLERASEVAASEPADLSRLLRVRPAPEVPRLRIPGARVPVKSDPPENDDCAGALPIGDGTVVGDTATANPGPLTCTCGFSNLSPDVWFKVSSPVPGRIFAHTYGSDFDTVLSVYRGCPDSGDCYFTCNDNAFGLQSAVDFEYSDDHEYYLRVSGFAGSSGPFQLTVGPGGAISGVVTDAATGESISSIEVAASTESGYYSGHGTSDPAGNYTIAGLAAATYYVRVTTRSDYLPEVYDGLPCPGGTCDPTLGDGVQVSLDSVTPGIDFALDLGGKIAGSVAGAAAGEPISSAWVRIYDAGGTEVGDDFTDDSGSYEVAGLAAGSYFAWVEASRYHDELYDDLPCPDDDGWGCDPTAGTPIEVALGATTAGTDFLLDRFGEITGSVTHRTTGEPVDGARVRVWDVDGPSGGAWTDPSGRFTVGGLVAGTTFAHASSDGYRGEIYDGLPCPFDSSDECDPRAGTPITVADNSTVSGIDFALTRLGAIAGTVTDAASGQPVWEEWSRVKVWLADGHWGGDGEIDSSGRYLVEGIHADSCFAITDTAEYVDEIYDDIPCPEPDWQCEPTIGTPIAVELETTTSGIDFALHERSAIAGTVTEEASGEPIAEAWVRVWDTAGQWIKETFADDEGDYRVAGLEAPGSYFVTAQRHGLAGVLYDGLPCPDGDCDPAGGTPVAVAVGATTGGIDFVLTRLGAISGNVTDAVTGDQLDHGCVQVWDVNGSLVDTGCIGIFGGPYAVESLAAGTYFASARSYDHLDQLYDGLPCPAGCDPTAGTPITVVRNTTTTGIDFALDRLGEISGQVTDALTGAALEYHAWVDVWNAAGERVGIAWVGHDGYTTEPLPPGTYFASARAEDYLDELYREMPCPEDCEPTSGTPITVTVNQTTPGIDFTLDPLVAGPLGGLAGTVTDELTGQPIPDATVRIWDASATLLEYRHSDSSGRYALYLPAGTYFAAVTHPSRHHPEVFDDLPCDVGTSGFCEPTTGTPITVSAGRMTPGIDFQLRPVEVVTCEPTPTSLCLGRDRFRVEVDWRDFQSNAGAGQGIELTTNTGYFWFFEPDNVEVVLKVLDACYPPFDHFWVFTAGLTNVECELTVTDTWTGEARTWVNPLGVPFEPILDTRAFATCDAAPPAPPLPGASQQVERLLAELERWRVPGTRDIPAMTLPAFATKGDCLASDTALCLNQDRFQAEAFWQTTAGDTGVGQAVALTADTGYFWFFSPDNVEIVLKVLDACVAPYDRFWVFAAGLTDVAVTLRVTDTAFGEVREYIHPMGTAFAPILDTDAFATCP